MGMMNEEAIKRLKEARNTMQPFQYVNEAIDYAIKVLEQQPSEDCISREALLNSLKGFEILHNHDELRSNLIYGIMNLPSVTPTISKMEQVEDCVARSEALDILDDFEEDIENGKFKIAYAKARERMCELSSVTPQQATWIPVSERLPEEPKRYLVYTRYDEVMTDYFYSDDYNSEFLQGEDIIAWMPLPEPYRESEE